MTHLADRSSEKKFIGILCKSLPAVTDISNDMHDRSHLCPHCFFHGHLGLVMVYWRRSSTRRILCLCTFNCHACWIRRGTTNRIIPWITLFMFSCGTAKSNVSEAGHKIACFLLYGFSLVFLGSAGRAVMAPKHASRRRLYSTCFRIDQR